MTLDVLKAKTALLRNLSGAEVELFESAAQPVSFAAGAFLLEEDAPCDVFYILESGRVGLEITTPGKAPFVLQTLGPGELVGVSWLFAPYRWSLSARAVVASRAVEFDAVRIREECQRDRDLGYRVAVVLAEEAIKRLHGARLQLLDFYRAED